MDFVSQSNKYMNPDLVGSSVDVVGTAEGQCESSYAKHPETCGEALQVGS